MINEIIYAFEVITSVTVICVTVYKIIEWICDRHIQKLLVKRFLEANKEEEHVEL